jgi:hypothetical protein
MDNRPDMKYTLFHFRRQTGKDKQTEFSVGRCLAWLVVALVAILLGHAVIPPLYWQVFKWW